MALNSMNYLFLFRWSI